MIVLYQNLGTALYSKHNLYWMWTEIIIQIIWSVETYVNWPWQSTFLQFLYKTPVQNTHTQINMTSGKLCTQAITHAPTTFVKIMKMHAPSTFDSFNSITTITLIPICKDFLFPIVIVLIAFSLRSHHGIRFYIVKKAHSFSILSALCDISSSRPKRILHVQMM